MAGRIGRVGLFGFQLASASAADVRSIARRADALGLGCLWLPESVAGHEVLSHAAITVSVTRRIVIATGIANVFARDPVAMSNGARFLTDASDGRFLLGLGVSQPSNVVQRGRRWEPPVRYLRGYLRAMDAGPSSAPPTDHRPLRVLAALGPKMLQLAADEADGAYPYFVPVEHTRVARGILGDGPILAVAQAVVVGEPGGLGHAAVQGYLARYLGRPNYVANLRRLGWAAADLADGGSATLADALVASGGLDEIRDRVMAHLEAGADHVCLHVLNAPDAARLDPHLQAIAGLI